MKMKKLLTLLLARKPGKLPCKTVQESYAKEYGIDTIEIHEDAMKIPFDHEKVQMSRNTDGLKGNVQMK